MGVGWLAIIDDVSKISKWCEAKVECDSLPYGRDPWRMGSVKKRELEMYTFCFAEKNIKHQTCDMCFFWLGLKGLIPNRKDTKNILRRRTKQFYLHHSTKICPQNILDFLRHEPKQPRTPTPTVCRCRAIGSLYEPWEGDSSTKKGWRKMVWRMSMLLNLQDKLAMYSTFSVDWGCVRLRKGFVF